MEDKRGIEWAAGLFEGEGTWIVRRTGYVQAGLHMTDEDVVEKFAAIVGCGRVGPKRVNEGTHKDSWLWQVGSRREVRRLAQAFLPYLGERRRARALEIIAATEGWETAKTSKYKTHCIRGHELTEENVYRQASSGTRRCRTCQRIRNREAARAKRGAMA
jgi:hypothetical protein